MLYYVFIISSTVYIAMKSSPKQTKSVRSSKQGTSDNSKSVRKKTDTKTPNKTTTHPTKSGS